jgi:hypothetical protein
VQQGLKQMRPAGPQRVASHVSNLLDDVGPIEGFIDRLARRNPAQQLGLVFGPDQNIGVVRPLIGGTPRST